MDIEDRLTLSHMELVHLHLAYRPCPISEGIVVVELQIVIEVLDGCLEVSKYGVGDGSMDEQVLLLILVLDDAQLSRQLVDERENLHGTVLVQLVLVANDIEFLSLLLGLHVECLHVLVERLTTRNLTG